MLSAVKTWSKAAVNLVSRSRISSWTGRCAAHVHQQLPGPLRDPGFGRVRGDAGQYGNNRIESDHGRPKARLRPMRGLKRLRSAAVIALGHAFVQNLRRGHDELATDTPPRLRFATAFTELALAI
jgi:transposase-like protein